MDARAEGARMRRSLSLADAGKLHRAKSTEEAILMHRLSSQVDVTVDWGCENWSLSLSMCNPQGALDACKNESQRVSYSIDDILLRATTAVFSPIGNMGYESLWRHTHRRLRHRTPIIFTTPSRMHDLYMLVISKDRYNSRVLLITDMAYKGCLG